MLHTVTCVKSQNWNTMKVTKFTNNCSDYFIIELNLHIVFHRSFQVQKEICMSDMQLVRLQRNI